MNTKTKVLVTMKLIAMTIIENVIAITSFQNIKII